MNLRFLILALPAFLPTLFAAAADPDHPGEQGFRVRCLALTGARIVVSPREVIERGTILLRDNRIIAVGPEVPLPPDAEELRLDGLTVYAGFIDAGNSALLNTDAPLPTVEARSVDVARFALAGLRPDDHASLTPQFRAAEALKLSTSELDKHRQAGLCVAHVIPTGRIASGQTAVVQLSGQPPREAVARDGDLVALHLLERRGGEYPSTMMGTLAHLRQTFLDADRMRKQRELYDQGIAGIERPPHDPVWDVFASLKRGERRTLFSIDSRDDLERALQFTKEQGLRPVLWGLHDLGRWGAALRDAKMDAIVTVNFGEQPKIDAGDEKEKSEFPQLPDPLRVRQFRRDRWQERVRIAKELHQAGLRFGFATAGLKSPDEFLKAVRQTITQGLPREAALAALTTQPAELLGMERDLGVIVPGKLANLVVMTGPFDHDQTKVRYTFVEGRRFEYHKDAKPVSPDQPSTPPLQVAGRWQLEIQGGDEKLPATVEFVQTGARLAGRFTSGQGDGTITSGQAGHEDLKFEVSIGAGDRAIVLRCTARLHGDRLEGTLKSPFGPSTSWTGKREPTSNGAHNPVQLTSVEADHDETPVSALSPASLPPKADELPTELPTDRTARPITTGGNVFIRGGTVITGTGVTLSTTSILVKNGLIAAIGPDLSPENGIAVIDATGRYVMPGIIDTHSHIMISNGLGGVNENTHSIVCEVRVADSLHSQDAGEYRALAGGVSTIRLLHGSANVIGGQDAVVQLKHGASMVQHLFPGAHSGVKFALGENVKFRTGRFPNTRLGVEATLQRAFVEALEYRRLWQEYDRKVKEAGGDASKLLPPRRDLRLEALAQIVSGEKFIHSHCYRSDEILMLLRVAASHGIRVWSLQHVLEGYKVAPEIVAHGASCSTFADWWAYKMEAFDAIPQNAALLSEAGANVVIKSDDAELMRHLYMEASKPVRYGNLSADLAPSLVTLNASKELGLSDRIGSIEVGKQADIAIFNGHPLNSFSRCEWTLIAGEPYFIREKQPSAMSAGTQSRTAKLAAWSPPKSTERRPNVDWSAVKSGKVALVGATIHPVDAPEIPLGTVLVNDGRIAGVSAGEAAPDGWPSVRLDGLHLYPGLIDAGTTVGLTEVGKVQETHDVAEVGLFQPDLRAAVAVNPDSELIPAARAGGITTAFVRPIGGVICGQASVIQLAGWTAPEMAVVEAAGLQINWPGAKRAGSEKKPGISEDAGLLELREWLRAARVYDKARLAGEAGGLPHLVDPRYEALRPYVRGEKPVFIQADSRQQIYEALRFAELEKLKIVICGGTDAWKLASTLKEKDVPVIVGPVMRKPIEDYDPFDAPYANAGRLHEAGVRFCIRSDNPSNSRNTPFEAAMAVAYGLPEEAALRGITLSAAEILGISDRCGSLSPGKRADFVILDGSPLQITSQVKGVMVAGKPFAPTSKQTELYDKYRGRLHEVRTRQSAPVAGP